MEFYYLLATSGGQSQVNKSSYEKSEVEIWANGEETRKDLQSFRLENVKDFGLNI